jgi:hypothetical protein
VNADELAVATRFRVALEQAAKTGDWMLVYQCLAPDIEWITPKRTLTGIDAVEHDLTWGSPPEHLDIEFQVGDWVELDDGRVAVDVHETYRMKGSGDFAYQRERRIEIAIRDGLVSRYEMKIVG